MKRILVILGTRPEAIKLGPLILQLRACADVTVRTCATAQHREMLDQALDVFGITADYDLDLMRPGQQLAQSTSRILAALDPVLEAEQPDMIVVQGDTTTTMCGALAGFYRRVAIGHVEAGLRTGDLWQPFPEEMNRLVAGRLATLHFAATCWAAENLLREGVAAERIHVTGNTGIDAVLYVRDGLESRSLQPGILPEADPNKRLIAVTTHRRESFGEGMEQICRALAALAERGDVQMVLPVHPNPNVRETVRRWLGPIGSVSLIEPLPYVSFVELLRRSAIVITDSGGIQEEAPSLGKPVLVLREKTERPEAVEAGTVKLVGTSFEKIVGEANRLLDDRAEYERMSRVHNPYGDGKACQRIAAAIRAYLGSGN